MSNIMKSILPSVFIISILTLKLRNGKWDVTCGNSCKNVISSLPLWELLGLVLISLIAIYKHFVSHIFSAKEPSLPED